MTRQAIQGLPPARVRHLLGDGFTHDLPGRITKWLDVDVWVLDITGDAYSLVVEGRRVIVAKRTVNWFRQNFSIAHELGHLAADSLCDGSIDDVTADHESAANGFAAELMLPQVQMRSLDWKRLPPPVLAERVWEWGVSTQAVQVRLRSLRILPGDEVAGALTMSTQALLRRYWDCPESSDLITIRKEHASERRVPTDLTSHLEKAVQQGRAPVESLAYALGVPPSDVEIDLPALADPARDIELLEGLL